MTDGEEDTSFAVFEQEQNAPPADPPEAASAASEEGQEPLGLEDSEEDLEALASAAARLQAKPKPTAQERIDEITRRSREEERRANQAEREAKYWKDVAEGRVKPQSQQDREAAPEAKAPNPGDFDFGETDPKYIEAVIDFRVEHGLKKGLDEVKADMAQNVHIQAAERAWEAKQDAARSEFADYDEVVQTHDPVTGAPKWPCSKVAAEAIQTSDAGAKIAYHLASHPDEARRIAALSPLAQVLELGKIEAAVAKAPEAKTEPTTNAPKPPTSQARGAGGVFAANAATENFEEFEALANRKAG